ncbi:hypothetical protein V6N11_036242 [Hibiscus sabdariffa]|uniref:Cytochrome P450 n=1 Tax=Hibiscus sabdariffa TaxID=183260 RepID=A0ABR2RAA2_9ROSI
MFYLKMETESRTLSMSCWDSSDRKKLTSTASNETRSKQSSWYSYVSHHVFLDEQSFLAELIEIYTRLLQDMLAAAMDSSAATIDWTLAELIRHPRVTKKLQTEIESVVGMKRMVEESDLEKLEYLNMVTKESFRLHPVAPLLVPHAAREDCTVNGFHIPKDARILINAWAIGRGRRVWTDADKFYPERFVGTDIDVRGQNFQLIPFGSGRRGCPGMQLALTMVHLVVAQLVHCFDWDLPDEMLPTELDMAEDFGLVCPRANNLLAIPTWRLDT